MAEGDPAPGTSQPAGPSKLDRIRANTWASLAVVVGLWIVLGFVLFLVFGFTTNNVALALVAGLVGGLAAAVALGYKQSLLGRMDQARRGAPLWARLLLPVPLLAFLFIVAVLLVGPIVSNFVVMILLVSLLALGGTAGVIHVLGLWRDVPAKVRATPRQGRLGALFGVGVVAGLLAFLLGLMFLEEARVGLAFFLPAMIGAILVTALLMRWGLDARDAARAMPIWSRLLLFSLLTLGLTLYFALLIGPSLPNALSGYAVALACALALTVPLSTWMRAWGDLWRAFRSLGEGHRVVAVLPVFPLAVVLIFLLIVVFTSRFDIAYAVSIPLGLLAFLAVGLAFRVTQDIPSLVKRQSLPKRSAILAAVFLLLMLYFYFALALFTQQVELSIILGMALAALVVVVCIQWFRLGEGLGAEFKTYGVRGELLVLSTLFILSLALSFVILALSTGDFGIAFLASVIASIALTIFVASATGILGGARTALAALPWWGELLVLALLLVLGIAYGTMAVGLFVANVPVALAAGTILGLVLVFAFQRVLRVGEDMLREADEQRAPRVVLLVITFLAGFLVGLFATAAILGAVGNDLFGLPFFVGILAAVAITLWFARSRGWQRTLMARVRTTRDRVKVALVLLLWLALGIFTGFALQSVPLDARRFDFSEELLPLSVTLALGLLLWTPLPVVLFRAFGVERTPMRATVSMGEKPKFLASLGWGFLAFLVIAVLLLSFDLSPPIAIVGAAILGYLVALAFSAWRGRGRKEPRRPIL